MDEGLVDDRLDHDRGPAHRVGQQQVHRDVRIVLLLRQVVLDDVAPTVGVGLVDDDHPVQPAWPDECRIEHFWPVGRSDDEHQRLVGDRPAHEAEPAQELVPPAILDQAGQRVHLVEQGVQALAPPHHHPAHHHAAAALAAPVHADRVDLVHEHDAGAALAGWGVLPTEPAGIPEELHDHHLGHAPEHAADRARVDVDERQLGLGRDDRGEERLAGARGSREEHAARHLAAAQLEFLDALEDPDRHLGVFEQVGLATVVGKGHPDLLVVGCYHVLARPRQEPEQEAELDDQVEGGEGQLEGEGRGRADDAGHVLEERDRAARGDERRDHRQGDEQPEQVLVPHEAQVAEEVPDGRHRKPSIFPPSTRMTRLIDNGRSWSFWYCIRISVADC